MVQAYEMMARDGMRRGRVDFPLKLPRAIRLNIRSISTGSPVFANTNDGHKVVGMDECNHGTIIWTWESRCFRTVLGLRLRLQQGEGSERDDKTRQSRVSRALTKMGPALEAERRPVMQGPKRGGRRGER